MPHRTAPRSACLMLLALAAAPLLAATPAGSGSHAWDGPGTPAALDAWVQQHLKAADEG